jgi:Tol biopolymer transport system component
MKKMRKTGCRLFAAVIAACVAIAALTITGCDNSTGNGNPNGGDGNKETENPAPPANRVFFIKTDSQTEALGTLSWISEGSSTVKSLSKKAANFSLNRDKTKMVFAESLTGYSGTWLAVMNLDGTGYIQTNVAGNNPCFSYDGTEIYFDKDGEILKMGINGNNQQRIDITDISASKKYPRLSPDGKKLAFYSSSPGPKWYSDDVVYLYVLDFESGGIVKLNADSIPVSSLSWKQDGTEITFNTLTGITPPVRNLYRIKADGSEAAVEIANDSNPATGACGYPAFFDDGSILCASTKNKTLNYRSEWDGTHYVSELASINPDGTGLKILLSGVPVRDPVFVPGNS